MTALAINVYRHCEYVHCLAPGRLVRYDAHERPGTPMHACCVADFTRRVEFSPADECPSIDQFDAASRILSGVAHPLVSGVIVAGHAASYCPRTLTYSLTVYVWRDPDEIWARPLTRCYRIAADGSYVVAVAEGHG